MHGPYHYLFWQDSGRLHKRYVRMADVELVDEATKRWKTLHPPVSRLHASLKELGDLLRFLTQEVQNAK